MSSSIYAPCLAFASRVSLCFRLPSNLFRPREKQRCLGCGAGDAGRGEAGAEEAALGEEGGEEGRSGDAEGVSALR